MAQASKVNNNSIQPALEKSLDILGDQSKKLILHHLSKMSVNLSSIEAIEQAMTVMLGEGAQIIICHLKECLQK